MYGNCLRLKCHGLHLSARGLVPYYVQMNMKKDTSPAFEEEDMAKEHEDDDINSEECDEEINDGSDDYIDEDMLSDSEEEKVETSKSIEPPKTTQPKLKFITSSRALNRNLQGVLVTENFLIDYYNSRKKATSNDNADSDESYETISKMREFLTDENAEDSLDESIFKV
jgi:hypothetical protein